MGTRNYVNYDNYIPRFYSSEVRQKNSLMNVFGIFFELQNTQCFVSIACKPMYGL